MTDLAIAPELTLRDVIAAVPERCRQRSTARGLGVAIRDTVLYGIAITGLILTSSWWATLLFWALAGMAISAMFVTGHDAAHLALTDNNRLNSWIGHVMFIPSMHIYEAWVLGHNRIHHGHTVRETMDFVWHPMSVEGYRQLSPTRKLLHRLEWSFLGAGVYYTRDVWWQKMIRLKQPPTKFAKKIRRDTIFLYSVLTAAAVGLAFAGGIGSGNVWGAIWMILEVMVIPAFLFMWIIGWTVYVHHIHEDIKWFHRRDWDKVSGQLDGTTVLRISKFWDFFFHSIFTHMPHHVDMRIPFYHLDEAAEAIKEVFPDRVIDRKLRLRDYLRSTRICKLYDFDAQQWVPYSAAADAPATA